MIKHTLLVLAMVGAAGTVHAQTAVDRYGPPPISSPPQPGPGEYTWERPGLQPMDRQAQAVSPTTITP